MNVSIENFTSPEVHLSTDHIIYLRTSLLCFNLVFGVPTHCYVIWTIVRGGRIPAEFFNVNLSVCGIIYSLIVLFYLLQIFSNIHLLRCFLQGLGICGRPLFQSLMCVEHYLAVVHPVTFLKYKPLRYRVICSIAAWIMTAGSCFGGVIIKIFSSLQAYAWFISLQLLLFLSIQLFCLVAVLRALKQSGPGERKREEENHMKRRAFHLILITTVTMIVMFVPFIVTGFISALQQVQQEASLIWFLTFCCFILSGFVQPVLYLHRAGKLFCLCSYESGCFRQITESFNLV